MIIVHSNALVFILYKCCCPFIADYINIIYDLCLTLDLFQ